MTNRRLARSLKKFSRTKEEKLITIAGELGLPLNGQKLVEVPNRKGFVYVRLRNNTSEVIQAYNSDVSAIYGLPVLVARANNIYKVIGRDLERYRDWSNVPYLPKHGGMHSFNPMFGMGADVVWVYSPQIMPLLGYPSGTFGSSILMTSPYIVRDLNGNWKYIGNTGTPDFTPYVPTTGAIMALVYLDTVSGNPYLLVNSGTYFDATLTGTGDISSYIPRVTNPNWIPETAVRLVTGTTQISWSNLYDVRPFFQVIPTGTSGGGTGTSFSWMIQDEGVPLGTATTLNVVGTVADISVSGTVARLFITGSTGGGAANPPITGSFVFQDHGQTLGSFLVLNAGNNLSASVSGSVARLDADTAYLQTDDFSSLTNGTGTSFHTTFVPTANTARLYYNGIRQRYTYDYTVSGSYVQTLFTPASGSVLLLDYNESSTSGTPSSGLGITGSVVVQDEGSTQGLANVLNFVGSGVVASVAGNIATINITGSTGGGSPWTQVVNENGSSFANWTSGGGTWSSDGTVIKQTNTGGVWNIAYLTARINTAPGFILEAEVKMVSTSGDPRTVGLTISCGVNNSQFGATGDMRLEGGNRAMMLSKAGANIKATNYSWSDGTFYTFRIISSGGVISGFINGVFIGAAGQTPASDAEASFIGLVNYGSEAHWKNIKGWALTLP